MVLNDLKFCRLLEKFLLDILHRQNYKILNLDKKNRENYLLQDLQAIEPPDLGV